MKLTTAITAVRGGILGAVSFTLYRTLSLVRAPFEGAAEGAAFALHRAECAARRAEHEARRTKRRKS